ncbi:sulfate transport system substrate-binding protein [Nocardioides aurantiacus]|uniref:Sulfate transport system substrate-binding protein n=2 Tax=Nocardioides aurantiacus TaxID=86796 RepID=A0A3N2CPT5_9ACTN|nr:sulfate transport system substrate-binding protein [Nocardioides aurantiacus]
MSMTWKAAVAGSVAALVALTGCGTSGGAGGSSEGGATSLSLVGFAVPEKANKDIQAAWAKTDAGKGVTWKTSYGASGDQSRAVESGLDADYVHFSLEGDVTRLVEAGLVAEDWNAGETKGIVSQSVVALVVRKGNPKNIQGWDDIVKPGVGIVTPNPGSSGSARWNIMAAWNHVIAQGGTEAEATAFVTKFFENAVALPGSGREATTAFTSGNGDVLISYENEAILARANGEDFDYVVPDDTLLIENPGAVLKDADPKAQRWLDFVLTDEAQAIFGKDGFRPLSGEVDYDVEGANDPSNPFPEPKDLATIGEDYDGWSAVNDTFFDEENGIITKIQAETGKQ